MNALARALAAVALALAALAGSAADRGLACGPETDCPVGARSYRIALPEGGRDGPLGAVLFSHGYRGSAAGTMADPRLRAAARTLGVALIATQAADGDWDLPNAPRIGPAEDGAREMAYFEAVLADAASRFGVDPAHTLATGFSAGGMVTWTLACRLGDRFMGFAPLAGTFWAPVPAACPSGPVDLVHVHGTADRVVPLRGRAIADTRQGAVPAALALMRSTGFAPDPAPVAGYADRTCRRWHTPGATAFLDYCEHPGGHTFLAEDVERAYRLMDRAGG